MKIHEYQAKKIFKEYNVNIPKSVLCLSEDDIESAVKHVGVPCVIKAQVHSGARGKAGGVKVVYDCENAIKTAKEILGMELKSSQAGVKKVNKILVEQAVNIEKELYLSFTFDRTNECITFIVSSKGGMEIEEVAKNNPDKIHTQHINNLFNPVLSSAASSSELSDNSTFLTCSSQNTMISTKSDSYTLLEQFNPYETIKKLDLDDDKTRKISQTAQNLYRLVKEKDASLVEINPLVITKENDIIAVDAKINFDDNALFRHEDIVAMKDETEENQYELEAQKYGLNYIKLNGTIGCMVNGAGLAMATMDVIRLAGKDAANFLDVGGGAGSDKIEKAFKLLMSDENIEAVFINIFGGILRCDFLAEGIKNAIKNLCINCPVIVRMEGTNKERGVEILNNSGLKFTVVKNLNEAIEVIKNI